LIQRAQTLGRKPRADVARITELVLVVIGAEQQGAETDPGIARIRKAAYYELALLDAFHLQPVRGSAASISRTAALGHDAFESKLTDFLEQLFALAFEMMHVADRAAVAQDISARKKVSQHLFASFQLHV